MTLWIKKNICAGGKGSITTGGSTALGLDTGIWHFAVKNSGVGRGTTTDDSTPQDPRTFLLGWDSLTFYNSGKVIPLLQAYNVMVVLINLRFFSCFYWKEKEIDWL